MAAIRDSFADLERHRQLLEEHVDKLSDALDEWRQWKTEYETLRAQVKEVPSTAPRKDLTRIREAYQGDLVTSKELAEIFGKNDSKKPDQVISVLTNRIEYVTKNVETLAKQLGTAENKLAGANVISNPDATDEEGLPITEIVEELDDDDNILSYSLRTPGSSQPQLLEALEKAGINGPSSGSTPVPVSSSLTDSNKPVGDSTATSNTTSRAPLKPKPKKKGVTFSKDTKDEDAERKSQIQTAQKVEEIMRTAKEQEAVLSAPVIPTDESEEDAQLRRDMLQYNLAEMNPIVAELSLEEGPYTDDDIGTDESQDEDDEEEEDYEDQWGRYTGSLMNDDYRQKMIEIQERLLNKDGHNKKKEGNDEDSEDDVQGIGHIKVTPNGPAASSTQPTSKASANSGLESSLDSKKSVRFAQNLDVAANGTAPASDKLAANDPIEPEVEPLSDVIERTSKQRLVPKPGPAKKTSKFKAARSNGVSGQASPSFTTPLSAGGNTILPERPSAERPIAPSGPEGQTLATAVLEREGASEPKEPDELDAGLLQQEVAVEYRKMHNRMIQRQGGFMKEDESPIQPLSEEEGGPKRLSRFKAARLARS